MNNFIIDSEKTYIDDINRLKKDKIKFQSIIKNDVLNAKLDNINFNDFIKSYRPCGNHNNIKEIWNSLNDIIMDDWVIIME